MVEDHSREYDESRRPTKKVKEGDERKKVIQTDPIKGFMMQPGENWSQDFCGKCIDERLSWRNICAMCHRWWIRGFCFSDCKNAASHVPGPEASGKEKGDFKHYMKAVRSS